MRTSVLLACLALVPACPAPDPQSDDEGTDSTDSTDSGTTGDDEWAHGTVKLEIAADDPGNPPFAETTQIVATVAYTDCLQDFYLSSNPELQQDGLVGAEVFADWIDRLCDPTLENVVACEVTDIDQTLIDETAVYQLKVTFAITDPAAIEDRWLYVGPLPTTELVGDACASPPQVEIRANGLLGRDAGNAQVWGIKTLPGSSVATTDQGAPLRVTVGI